VSQTFAASAGKGILRASQQPRLLSYLKMGSTQPTQAHLADKRFENNGKKAPSTNTRGRPVASDVAVPTKSLSLQRQTEQGRDSRDKKPGSNPTCFLISMLLDLLSPKKRKASDKLKVELGTYTGTLFLFRHRLNV
jgi:hypothetical protein